MQKLDKKALVFNHGNRCGHDKNAPQKFKAPENHALRPKLVREISKRVNTYFHNPKALPSLNAANGSRRQQRSERRESCIKLMGAILHYTDVLTLRVGILQADGKFLGIKLETLADRAGLNIRRAERASRDLVASGILSVSQKAVKDNATGEFKGRAAIRAVSKKLFTVFAMDSWLTHERRRASEKFREYQEKASKAKAAKAALAMDAMRNEILARGKRTGETDGMSFKQLQLYIAKRLLKT